MRKYTTSYVLSENDYDYAGLRWTMRAMSTDQTRDKNGIYRRVAIVACAGGGTVAVATDGTRLHSVLLADPCQIEPGGYEADVASQDRIVLRAMGVNDAQFPSTWQEFMDAAALTSAGEWTQLPTGRKCDWRFKAWKWVMACCEGAAGHGVDIVFLRDIYENGDISHVWRDKNKVGDVLMFASAPMTGKRKAGDVAAVALLMPIATAVSDLARKHEQGGKE